MIGKLQDAVREFFNMTGEGGSCVETGQIPDALALVNRSRVMREEFTEYSDAMMLVLQKIAFNVKPTLEERANIADSLCDLIYYAVGTGLTWGFDVDAMLEVVHQANMTKGKLTSFGRVEKPPGFQHPNLTPFVRGPQDAED